MSSVVYGHGQNHISVVLCGGATGSDHLRMRRFSPRFLFTIVAVMLVMLNHWMHACATGFPALFCRTFFKLFFFAFFFIFFLFSSFFYFFSFFLFFCFFFFFLFFFFFFFFSFFLLFFIYISFYIYIFFFHNTCLTSNILQRSHWYF